MSTSDSFVRDHLLHIAVGLLYVIYFFQIPPILMLMCLVCLLAKRLESAEHTVRMVCEGSDLVMTKGWSIASTFSRTLMQINGGSSAAGEPQPQQPQEACSKVKRLITGEMHVLAIANSYKGMHKKLQLPSTHLDLQHIRPLFKACKIKKMFLDQSATKLGKRLSNSLGNAARASKPCGVFLSMHGTGGATSLEALIGDDGEQLTERQMAEILCAKSLRQIPWVVFILDSCNSGGILNLVHCYSIDKSHKLVLQAHGDSVFGRGDVLELSFPCLCISAVSETQYAEAFPNGSNYTMELMRAHQDGRTLWSVLCDVSDAFRKRTADTGAPMSPTVSFNKMFACTMGGTPSSTQDALSNMLQQVSLS